MSGYATPRAMTSCVKNEELLRSAVHTLLLHRVQYSAVDSESGPVIRNSESCSNYSELVNKRSLFYCFQLSPALDMLDTVD